MKLKNVLIIITILIVNLSVKYVLISENLGEKKEDPAVKSSNPAEKKEKKYEMVYVEGGTFKMGSNSNNIDEKPIHTVKLNSFYIGKYEVTQKEWIEIMGTTPSNFVGDNLPVDTVSWYDAIEFCNRKSEKDGLRPSYKIDKTRVDPNSLHDADNLKWSVTVDWKANGYRLPTEAEWEYAARGGKKSKGYLMSGSDDPLEVAWYIYNSYQKPHDVGTLQANELGIHDMSGNLWEWCWDWYREDYYSVSPESNPKGAAKGLKRVLRGGCWILYDFYTTVTVRDSTNANVKYGIVGFRLARSKR